MKIINFLKDLLNIIEESWTKIFLDGEKSQHKQKCKNVSFSDIRAKIDIDVTSPIITISHNE